MARTSKVTNEQIMEMLMKMDARISALEKNSSSKEQADTQPKADPKKKTVKDFAPKSATNYASVKAARRAYVGWKLGKDLNKEWVDHDTFTKTVKPWDKEFGTWVAGQGLQK